MYRRSTIPNEASLTAFEILELTTQQYHPTKKRKGSPEDAKTSSSPRVVARKAAPGRPSKKS
jgi:hypothetical protein